MNLPSKFDTYSLFSIYCLHDLMFFLKYLSLLEIKEISIICSKPYGFELLIILYDQTHNNHDTGVEETFEKLNFKLNIFDFIKSIF